MSGRPRSSRTTSGRRLSQRARADRAVGRLVDPVAAARELADERRPASPRRPRRRRIGRSVAPSGRRGRHAGGRRRPSTARRRRAAGRCRSRGRRARSAARCHPTRPSPRPGRARRPGRSRCPSASRRRAGHPVELVEELRQGRVGDARPGVLDREPDRAGSSGSGAAEIRIGASGRRVLDRVLEDVRHGLVEEAPGRRRPAVRRGRSSAAAIAEARAGAGSIVCPTRSSSSNTSRSARRAPASIRLRSSRLVTSRLRYSTSRSMASALSCWSSAAEAGAGSQRPGGGPDRRQRRPQVVRHRLQQRRLERVALARDLGGLGLRGEPVLGQRLADLVGGGGQQPRLRPVGLAAIRDRASPRSTRTAVRRPRSGPGRPPVPLAPAARGAVGDGHARHRAGVSSGVRCRTLIDAGEPGAGSIGLGVGCHPFARVVGAKRDPDALHRASRRAGCRRSRAGPRGVDSRCASARLTWNSARASRSRAFAISVRDALEGDELADDDADEQQQDEVQPLVRVGDGERVQRQDEQEVVEHERRDGGDDRAPRPGDERRRDDRREIDRRGVLEARRLEQRDRERRDARATRRPRRRAVGPRVDRSAASHDARRSPGGRGPR